MGNALLRVLPVMAWAFATVLRGTALADYETHPAMAPDVRCASLQDLTSPTGYTPDCQPLFWDLPAATHVGEKATAAPDLDHGFLNGKTDRPPPLFTDPVSGKGYESPSTGRQALCPLASDPTQQTRDPDLVPYWKLTGQKETVTDLYGNPYDADIYEVACRRGTRAYFGPWTLGTSDEAFDKLDYKIVKFENSARLDRDGLAQPAERREFNVGSEIYTHHAAHHAFCDVSADRCNDGNDPAYANSPACDSYRALAGQCPAESSSSDCGTFNQRFQSHRTTTSRQGRYTMDLPPGRAFTVVEDPLWLCNQHLINDEPPAYGSKLRRNFRHQQSGAVGEMVIQFFTEPMSNQDLKPVSLAFDRLVDTMTTFVPPFTIGIESNVWYAPFDLAIGMATLHSHENMVRGNMQILPAGAPRMGSTRTACGGSQTDMTNPSVYENWSYIEPEICEYWREADGPIILRKGEAVRTQCIVNNGVTQTDQIDDPALRTAVENSVAGNELLFGRQDPSAYRVRYGCEEILGVPPGMPTHHAQDCPPNPATDSEGRPVESGYDASADYCPTRLGFTGKCVPANVVFANTAEDAMCIPILMYWPLDRVLDADGSLNDDAASKLEEGKVDEVGAPGRVYKSPSDFGSCDDGAGTGGVNVDDPNPISPGRNCRAGL